MRCPRCACPGAALVFTGVLCFNGVTPCAYFDPKAWDKAPVDKFAYTVNGDGVFEVESFLAELRHPSDED